MINNNNHYIVSVFPELMISLTEKRKFFKRPEKRHEIIGNRKKIEVEKDGIVNALFEMKDDEALILREPLYDTAKYETRNRFLKRGPELRLNKRITRRDAITQRLRPRELRREAFSQLEGELHSGCCHVSYRNAHLRYHLDDCISGTELFAFCEPREPIEVEEVREYRETEDVINKGAVYTIDIPSRSSSTVYPITLRSFPIPIDKTQYAVWMNLTAQHNCKDRQNSFSFKYAIEEVLCAHIIAAYLAAAKKLHYSLKASEKPYIKNEEGDPDILIPFALPSQEAVRIRRNMDHVWVKLPEEKGRPMNRAYREAGFFEGFRNGGPDFFYARKKLKDMFSKK